MLHLLSLFSGIGAFEKALDNIGADYRLINYCEIDQYAAGAFARVHGVSEDLNLHDVTTVDPASLPRVDLITYGFPCQDISVAGRQRGFVDAEGNSTRSGLFFEALRIIRGCRPLYAIAENVKALTSKKFTEEFKTVLDGLAAEGYVNYWAVLNAKDYGVPQNRERVFIVSIRADADMGIFKFPEKIQLTCRMKDFLEPSVDKKFYIASDRAQRLLESLSARDYKNPGRVLVGGSCLDATVGFDGAPRVYTESVPTLRAGRSGLMVVEDEPKIMPIGNFVTTGNFRNPQRGRVYASEGLSPTLNTVHGGDTMPHIIEPVCAASRGRNPENPGDRSPGIETEQRLEIKGDGVCNALTTVQKDNYVLEPKILCPVNAEKDGTLRTIKAPYYKTSAANMLRTGSQGATGVMAEFSDTEWRIRKLTPRECWRLQGFTDEDFDRAAAGASNCQLYKMAGNSIAVPCLEAIFRTLLEGQHALLEVISGNLPADDQAGGDEK